MEYRLRKTLMSLRAAFASGDTEIIHWVPGKVNLAEKPTKRTCEMSKNLNKLLKTGV